MADQKWARPGGVEEVVALNDKGCKGFRQVEPRETLKIITLGGGSEPGEAEEIRLPKGNDIRGLAVTTPKEISRKRQFDNLLESIETTMAKKGEEQPHTKELNQGENTPEQRDINIE